MEKRTLPQMIEVGCGASWDQCLKLPPFSASCRLMILDVVKDKENYQKYLHEYKRLNQRKRRIWEITQEKAHA